MIFFISFALTVGFAMGLLTAWFYVLKRHSAQMRDLSVSGEKREHVFQLLQARLEEQVTTVKRLRAQMSYDEAYIHELTAQVQECEYQLNQLETAGRYPGTVDTDTGEWDALLRRWNQNVRQIPGRTS
jgi:chromosome segregation ATPase